MAKNMIKTAALTLTAGTMAMTTPVAAAPAMHAAPQAHSATSHVLHMKAWENMEVEHKRHKHRHKHRHGRYYDDYDGYYDEPIYRDTRTWRGRDGRYYCRKSDGTTGLIVGGAAGALLGREIDTRGDRTLGTVLGAAAGALIGKEIDSKRRCR